MALFGAFWKGLGVMECWSNGLTLEEGFLKVRKAAPTRFPIDLFMEGIHFDGL